MTNKRRRKTSMVDTQLVEIYEDLANVEEEIRLKAAQTLLLKIAPEAGLASQQIHEILRRLIRGLCSGRKAARLGFSVALTEFLIQQLGPTASCPLFAIPEVIEVLKTETYIVGNVSGQEERNHYFGRLFGAETVIKSSILFYTIDGFQSWSQVLDLILGLAKRKLWLREECGWVLYCAIQDLSSGGHDFKYVQEIIDKVQDNGLTNTPEGVALWIVTSLEFPQVRLPQGIWLNENPMHRKEKAKLATVLKETVLTNLDDSGADPNVSQNGVWTSKLHFAWNVVLGRVLSVQSLESSKDLDLASFWEECVDRNLFTDLSSNERKYWGFLAFQRAIRDAPAQSFYIIFSKNLMRCLTNQLALPERYLHRLAEKSVKAILLRAKEDASVALPALECLLTPPKGQINFDQATKTKTVEKLLALVKNSSLRDLVIVFRKLIWRPGTQDQKAAASRRQLLADQLVNIVRSRLSTDDNTSTSSNASKGFEDILALFAKLAYFTHTQSRASAERSEDPLISTSSMDMFKSRISSCLTLLVTKSSNPAFFAHHVVCKIHSWEKSKEPCISSVHAYDAASVVLRKSWKVLKSIHLLEQSSELKRRPVLIAFKLLFSLAILQVYNFDADAVGVLEELKDCYGTLVKHKNKRAQGGSDALIEIILSFVAKPSLLFRRLGQRVFSACVSTVDGAGLQSMIKVLMTKETISGQEEMFDRVDDADRDDEISDVEEVEVIDCTTIEMSAQKDHNSGKDSAECLNNEETLFSEVQNIEHGSDAELVAFDAKLAQALKNRSTEDDRATIGNDEFTDEDMNDEQMEALDEQLGKVFRGRKKVMSKKSQKKGAKETIVNFKCRVLELLEIFIKHQNAKLLTLDLLVPILRTIHSTSSTLVSAKACGLIRTYTKVCKGENLPNAIDTDPIFDLLKKIHNQATKDGSNAYNSSCSQASLLVVKILVAQDRENLRRILLIYSETQERALLDPRCGVKVSFFSDWLNWCSSFVNTTRKKAT
ncbi:DNA-directed DNA polymerase [Pseudocyphellaria aurata]|nr:DNA-directed DNA polymerase [Pseudocyphellaria aurata]